jgi:hypothetical protein
MFYSISSIFQRVVGVVPHIAQEQVLSIELDCTDGVRVYRGHSSHACN